jgi:hypothetical protein
MSLSTKSVRLYLTPANQSGALGTEGMVIGADKPEHFVVSGLGKQLINLPTS